jgi:hypothetical protein
LSSDHGPRAGGKKLAGPLQASDMEVAFGYRAPLPEGIRVCDGIIDLVSVGFNVVVGPEIEHELHVLTIDLGKQRLDVIGITNHTIHVSSFQSGKSVSLGGRSLYQ